MSIYLEHYGLEEPPFAITPDPRYVYLSRRHEDALAHLLYGIGQGGSGGFVQLTGEVGTGKTTLCRCLLEQVSAETRIALILNPMLKPRDLLLAICDELGISQQRSDTSRELVNRLYKHLLEAHASGERVVLVIDEAQNMSRDALEQVRLLTNLETHTDKLLQIILLGQPELRSLLARQELRQLAQRITARYHLQPLDRDETETYVKHRLAVAGVHRSLFKPSGYRVLYQLSGGVPRLINILADRALLGAYAANAESVNGRLVKQASNEIAGDDQKSIFDWLSSHAIWAGALTSILLVSVAYAAYKVWPSTQLASTSNEVVTTQKPQANDVTQGAVVDLAVNEALDGLDDWLNTAQLSSVQSRWATIWRMDSLRIASACGSVGAGSNSNVGIFCTHQPGGWGRIRQLNLPVLIDLQATGKSLLVEGVQADNVLLNNGEERRWIPMSALRGLWSGGYTAICPGASESWRTGIENPEILRLKTLASDLLEEPYQGPMNTLFDSRFADWLANFQSRNGLRADRILGEESKLFLCAASAITPKLLSSAETISLSNDQTNSLIQGD